MGEGGGKDGGESRNRNNITDTIGGGRWESGNCY